MLFTIKTISMLIVVITFTWLNVIVTTEAFAQYYSYNVTIKTSSAIKFSEHKGKIKIDINYTNSAIKSISTGKEHFTLTPNDVKIAMNRNYTSQIYSFVPLANISSIDLRWTLKSPYNPIYLMSTPIIYFDPILISHNYNDPNSHLIVTLVSKYCPITTPIGIKHKSKSTFYPCK
ncbi:uncharacterized protein LOC128395791 [Panonychus citri]|uniref:uncharacterized protein LOC128395791 n=1 Tax=Panonychus citri TaxID=50023 RepID=UPI002306FC65|nr:uncharacterized protein LOC128395791 [Panonychus citri]